MRTLIIMFVMGMAPYITGAQPDFKNWDNFLQKYVSATGEVDYKAIKAQKKELEAIIKAFSSVKVASTWHKNDQLAFWINAYNAFTIDLIIQHYPLKSIQQLDGGKPWDVKRIVIGGKKYSLNNIENDIIRPQFKDARIHFAVNCAARSCPPLLNRAFMGNTLDTQLDMVAKKFIQHKSYQTITASKLTLSKIFEWYSADFGDVVTFVNKYSSVKVQKGATIVYKEYDWSLNGK